MLKDTENPADGQTFRADGSFLPVAGCSVTALYTILYLKVISKKEVLLLHKRLIVSTFREMRTEWSLYEKECEFVSRQFAILTGGTCVFLTKYIQ